MTKYVVVAVAAPTRSRLNAAKTPMYRTTDEILNHLLDIYDAHQQLPVPRQQDPPQQSYDERDKKPKTVQKRSRR